MSTTVSRSTLYGGDGAEQTVRLSAPATKPFTFVDLLSNDPAYDEGQPGSTGGVRIPPGKTSITFPIRVFAPTTEQSEDFVAQAVHCGPAVHSNTVTVLPLDPAKLAVERVSFSPAQAVAGTVVTATIELTAPARSRGTGLFLFEDGHANNGFDGYPYIPVVPAGQRSVQVPVKVIGGFGDAALTADLGTSRVAGGLFVAPAELFVSGAVAPAGRPTRALVGLGTTAPAGGATVRVSTDAKGLHVPATVTVPAGDVGGPFRITVDPGVDLRGKTITVRWNGQTHTEQLFYS